MNESRQKRVFISYSWDSEDHKSRVLQLADALIGHGQDVVIDQYVLPGDMVNFPIWMEQQVERADFVLMICTARYRRSAMGEEKPNQASGVKWESICIHNEAYYEPKKIHKYIPLLLNEARQEDIPKAFLGRPFYHLTRFELEDNAYQDLIRHLTNQPPIIRPPPGSVPHLPPKVGSGPAPKATSVAGASSTPIWKMPYPRNGDFTGRSKELETLEKAIFSDVPAANGQAISGLGGIGKTQTAIEFAYRHRHRFRAVFWVRADTVTELENEYREIASLLGLKPWEPTESDQGEPAESDHLVKGVKGWLASNPGWLLIFDNADTLEILKTFLPSTTAQGSLLFTTRAHYLGSLGIKTPVELGDFSPEEALAFLLKRTGQAHGSSQIDHAAAKILVGELSYFPLALEQAAAYMLVHEESIADYLAAYRCLPLNILEEHAPEAGNYPATVRTTWKRSFDALEKVSPASVKVLEFAAFLAPDSIPYELFPRVPDQWLEPLSSVLARPGGPDHAFNAVLTPLMRYSLIRRDPSRRTFSAHRLVQMVMREQMGAELRAEICQCLLNALDRALIGDPEDAQAWPRMSPFVEHVTMLLAHFAQAQIAPSAKLSSIASQTGKLLLSQARFAEAEPMLRRAVATEEALFGALHTKVAGALNDLADLLHSTNRSSEAERLCRRALAIDEALLGLEHADVARDLSNLATVLSATNRLPEAEDLYKRALAIDENALGPNDPKVAEDLNDLAVLLRESERFAEAEPLYRRSLLIDEGHFGTSDPKVAIRLSNLAEVLKATDRFSEAEPMIRRALSIVVATFGPEHPKVALMLNNLGGLLSRTKRFEEAEEHFRRGLAIDEERFGLEHPHIARDLNNLSVVLVATNRLLEAEPLHKRACLIFLRSRGANHPRSLKIVGNYRRLLLKIYVNPGKVLQAMHELCKEASVDCQEILAKIS